MVEKRIKQRKILHLHKQKQSNETLDLSYQTTSYEHTNGASCSCPVASRCWCDRPHRDTDLSCSAWEDFHQRLPGRLKRLRGRWTCNLCCRISRLKVGNIPWFCLEIKKESIVQSIAKIQLKTTDWFVICWLDHAKRLL